MTYYWGQMNVSGYRLKGAMIDSEGRIIKGDYIEDCAKKDIAS